MVEKRKLTREELDQWFHSLPPEQRSELIKEHKLKKTVLHHLNLIKQRKLNDVRKQQIEESKSKENE